MDYDYSWRDPTEKQIKALEYVYLALHNKKLPELPTGITHHLLVTQTAYGRAAAIDAEIYDGFVFKQNEYDLAELILLSQNSLWYSQAKAWAKEKPSYAPITWQLACQFLVKVVELGYDEEAKQWWNLDKLNLKDNGLNFNFLLLLDFANMLKQARKKSMNIYSQGFELFVALVVTKKRIREIKKLLKQKE